MIKHTKTPYSLELVEAGVDPAHYRIVSDSDMSIIVVLHCQSHQISRMKEDAEFMIKACNNYDKLIEGLKLVLDLYRFELYERYINQGKGREKNDIMETTGKVNDNSQIKLLQQIIRDAEGA